jgi:hypothetical protein
MTRTCRINNIWVSGFIAMITQIILIFSFLTVFFFVYVVNVEKQEFRKQLNLIVDNLLEDIMKDLPQMVDKSDMNKDMVNFMVNGIIDVAQEKIIMETKDSSNDVRDNNLQVRNKAYKTLVILIGCIVIVSITLLVLGFCLSLKNSIKESLLGVLYIGLTELIFLTIITRKYVSVDPNSIRRELGHSVMKWVEKHKQI